MNTDIFRLEFRSRELLPGTEREPFLFAEEGLMSHKENPKCFASCVLLTDPLSHTVIHSWQKD